MKLNEKPEPVCEVCGKGFGVSGETAVKFFETTPGAGWINDVLATICLRCFARGVLYAARASLLAEGCVISEPLRAEVK